MVNILQFIFFALKLDNSIITWNYGVRWSFAIARVAHESVWARPLFAFLGSIYPVMDCHEYLDNILRWSDHLDVCTLSSEWSSSYPSWSTTIKSTMLSNLNQSNRWTSMCAFILSHFSSKRSLQLQQPARHDSSPSGTFSLLFGTCFGSFIHCRLFTLVHCVNHPYLHVIRQPCTGEPL